MTPSQAIPQPPTPQRPPAALRRFFSLAGGLAPDLAAYVAERLWFTPPRVRSTATAREALSKGTALPLTIDGRRMAAWSFGRGPLVVLMHGWGGVGSQLQPFIAPLVERGYQVVTFDALGHGASARSPAGRRQSTFFDFAAGLRAIEAAAGRLSGLIAHSGGAVATALALGQGLTVKRLALIAPMTRPASYAAQYGELLGLSADLQERWQRRAFARLKTGWDSLDVTLLHQRVATPPTLVVHSRDDREVPFLDGELLATRWPGAQLHAVTGLGHRRLLKDPDVVRRTVEFVAQ